VADRTGRATRAITAALALATGLACAPDPPPLPSDWAPAFTPAAFETPDGSSEPQLTNAPGGVVLSWIEGQEGRATIRFAERGADGWTAPRTVRSGDDWFRSYADMPAVYRLSTGTLLATWLPATDLLIEAYDIAMARSDDGGLTWSAPFAPHDDGTLTQHGFVSVVERPEGGVDLVWLDGRQQELDLESPDGGAMSLRHAAFDADWIQVADTRIDARVCECCPTALARTSNGLVAAYRDRADDEVRDIAVTRLVDGAWSEATPVADDAWLIDACPVNGPALDAGGRRIAVSWFTAATGTGHSFLAFSDDGGATFGPPVQLDDGSALGRTGVALLPDGSAVAIWLEFVDRRAQVRARRVAADGAPGPPVILSGTGDTYPTGYPRLVLDGDTLVAAWTESTPPVAGSDGLPGIRVRVTEARLR
jgi:hypothetical protein